MQTDKVTATGPNPWKVAIILEQLSIPYETEFMDMSVLHQKPFENINPNGRVPAIHDPNTNVTLWESGAIIEYLVETYDKSSSLTYTTSPEKYQVKQWLHFQMSGQGPYYGQAAWFVKFHPERIESATKRYQDQILRVLHVINMHLTETGKPYLVGDKVTYADLSFLTWDMLIPWIFGDATEGLALDKTYPAWSKWHKTLMDLPSVKKITADKKKAMSGGK